MKKTPIYILFSLLLVGLLITSTSCQNQSIQPHSNPYEVENTNGKNLEENNMSSGSDKETPIYQILSQTPQYVDRIVDADGTGILFKADVQVPLVSVAPSLVAEMENWDSLDLPTIFFGNQSYTVEDLPFEGSQKRVIDGISMQKKEYVSQQGTQLFVDPAGSLYYRTSVAKDIMKLLNISDALYEQPDDVDIDLSFMDQKHAIDIAKKLLKSLSINPSLSPRVYSFSHQKLKDLYTSNEVKIKQMDEVIDEAKNEGKLVDDKIKGEWTEEDECYYMMFSVDFYGIPSNRDSYFVETSEQIVRASEINLLFNKDGIQMVDIFLYREKNILKNPTEILSLDEAINCLRNKMQDIILREGIEINHITFQYVGRPIHRKPLQIELVPAWVLYEKNGILPYRFDAITGEEIL